MEPLKDCVFVYFYDTFAEDGKFTERGRDYKKSQAKFDRNVQ